MLPTSGGTMTGNLTLQGTPNPLTIPAGATDSYVLTSDADGNASWAEAPGASGGMANPMTASGDMIKGGSSGTPQPLHIGSTGQVLTVSSGAPAWEALPAATTGAEGVVQLAGDLTGSASAPVVAKIQGTAISPPDSNSAHYLSATGAWTAPAGGGGGGSGLGGVTLSGTPVAGDTVVAASSSAASWQGVWGTRPEWFGTIGTGSDGAVINAAISAVSAGTSPGPVVLTQAYNIEETITLLPGVNLAASGQGNRGGAIFPDTFTGGVIQPATTFTGTALITIGATATTSGEAAANPCGATLTGVNLSGLTSSDTYIPGLNGVLVTDTADVHMINCFLANFDRSGSSGTCVKLSSLDAGNGYGFNAQNCILSASYQGIYGDGAGITDMRISGCLYHSSTQGLTLGPTAGGGGAQLCNNHYTYAGMPSGGWHLQTGSQAGDFAVTNEYFDQAGSNVCVQLGNDKGVFSGNHFLAASTSTATSLASVTVAAPAEMNFCGNDCNGNGSSIKALLQTTGHAGIPAGGTWLNNTVYGTAADLISPLIDSADAAIPQIQQPPGGTTDFLRADGTWNVPSGAQQVEVTGLHADGVTDDGPVIQGVLAALGTSGDAHSFEVIAEAPPSGVIYINSSVAVQTSGTRLRFGSPLLFGPGGRLRIYGAYASTPASGFPHLTANVASGATSIPITNITYFAVGSYIEIRGDHDATGAALWEDYVTVTAITAGSGTTGTLTVNQPLANAYSVTYTDGDYTEIVAITSSLCTTAPSRGDVEVVVGSTAPFAAGEYVQVLDDSLVTSNTGSPQPQNYYHREIAQIREVVDSTHLLLSHALHHSYVLAQNARVTQLVPVLNSEITGAQVTWSAMSTVEDAFEIRYGVQCSVRGCRAAGNGTYSWLSDAFRQTDSYMSYIEDCYADWPVNTSAGNGYGATLYGATYCTVRNCKFSACRHSVLHYNGAAGNEVTGCKSEDACLSDYDLHGAEDVDNWIHDCIAVGGDSVPTDDATPIKCACKAGNENHIQGDDYNTFSDISVVNYAYNGTAGAMQVVAQGTGNTFRNIRVKNASNGIVLVDNSSDTTIVTTGTTVDGCIFEDCANLTNINGGTSSTIAGVAIQNCTFTRASTSLSISNASDARIIRNTWIDPEQGSGVYTVSCSGVTGGCAVKGNEMSGSQLGVSLTNCPGARVTGNTLHDLVSTTVLQDGGGNTGLRFAANEIYGYAPTVSVTGTQSSGGAVLIYQPYEPDVPAKHGWLEWNFAPDGNETGTTTPVAGTIYRMKITAQNGGTVSNILVYLGQVGSGTAANCYVALYGPTGTQLGVSSDQSSSWTSGSTGVRAVSIGSAVITGGSDYYAELLIGTQPGTTAIGLGRGAASIGLPNGGFTSAGYRYATDGTGASALASSITPSSGTGTSAIAFWVGLS